LTSARKRAPRHSKVCFRGHRRKAGPDGKWYCPTCKRDAVLRRLCTVDGCTRRRHKQGWCGLHFKRFEQYGDPLLGPPPRGGDLCRNGHKLQPGTGGRRKCPVCEERRLEQNRICSCGAPREKGKKKCDACLERANQRRQLRATCRRFGITVEQYEAMLRIQGGRCAVCRNQPRTRRLAIDHDHQTMAVRGLLCHRCNRGILGHANDSVDLLRRAVEYLERPPANDILGQVKEAATT
jgi:Recombination endonuclease VII